MIDPSEMLRVLRGNRGWAQPERWLDYALSQNFVPVGYSPRDSCPDCGQQARRVLGAYVYYSSRIRLIVCEGCALVYADTLIDPAVVARHFERAYKDEEYFREQREPVFRQLAGIVSGVIPRHGTVLDVGGATGHLLALVRTLRPDVIAWLNDSSLVALERARSGFGLQTIPGTIAELESCRMSFDAVIMSDVIYYEPDVRALWRVASRLVVPGGTLILRIPNKFLLIRAGCMIPSNTRVRFFNPEHLYVFRRSYVERRLVQAGFTAVRSIPSVTPGRGPLAAVGTLAAKTIHALSRAIVSPSFVVVASKGGA